MDKIKVVFKRDGLEITGLIDNSVDNIEDLRKFVKTCKRAIVDLSETEIQRTIEKGEMYNLKNAGLCEEETEKPIEYASEGQKRYMDKLGIAYTNETTKYEAIDLINAWKIAHNIPISGKGGN